MFWWRMKEQKCIEQQIENSEKKLKQDENSKITNNLFNVYNYTYTLKLQFHLRHIHSTKIVITKKDNKNLWAISILFWSGNYRIKFYNKIS